MIPSFLRGSVALCGILFFISAVPLRAQTAGEIEALLESPAVTRDRAARFVLDAADIPGASGGGAAAFALAVERGWLPSAAAPGGPIRLDEASLLLMGAFAVRGGLLYRWFKNPHYAYRDLRYRQVIPGGVDPDHAVSGDLLLFLIGRMMALRETGEAAPTAETGGLDVE